MLELHGWKTASGNKKIHKDYEFVNFTAAMRFVNDVAKLAEKADHHPEMTINYNKVLIALSTHSAGKVTDLDFDLARQIDLIREPAAA